MQVKLLFSEEAKQKLIVLSLDTCYECLSIIEAWRKQLSPKGESFIVRSRQYSGGLHHQLTDRQIGQASGGFDLHSSRCAVGYHS